MFKEKLRYFLVVFATMIVISLVEWLALSYLSVVLNLTHWIILGGMLLSIFWINPRLTYTITEQMIVWKSKKEVV